MQKLTSVALCRNAAVFSPGFSTDSLTWIPGAKPGALASASGCTISDSRRPFPGRGWLAKRSISASISRLVTTMGVQYRFSSRARSPERSEKRPCMSWKSFLNSFMRPPRPRIRSYSLDGVFGSRPRQPRLRLRRLVDCTARTARSRPLEQLDPESKIGNAHAHRLEERYIVPRGALTRGGDKPGERHHFAPSGRPVLRHEFARELLHARKIVHGHQRGARKDVLREFLPVRRDRAHGIQVSAVVEHCRGEKGLRRPRHQRHDLRSRACLARGGAGHGFHAELLASFCGERLARVFARAVNPQLFNRTYR